MALSRVHELLRNTDIPKRTFYGATKKKKTVIYYMHNK